MFGRTIRPNPHKHQLCCPIFWKNRQREQSSTLAHDRKTFRYCRAPCFDPFFAQTCPLQPFSVVQRKCQGSMDSFLVSHERPSTFHPKLVSLFTLFHTPPPFARLASTPCHALVRRGDGTKPCLDVQRRRLGWRISIVVTWL